MERRVAIVGAGITGLAAAYYLEKRARDSHTPLRCILIESSGQPGGKITTRREKDFVIEGGPDSFITDKPWALTLCHELGLADELIPSNQRNNKIYMWRHDQLVPFPAGFRLTIPTQLMPFITTPLISPSGKLRMALEWFLPARTSVTDESVGEFVERRFGREAVELFGGPLMAGIYVSDPYKLSMQGTFSRFIEMEKKHGSLIRAARRMKTSGAAERPGPAPAGHAMFNSLKGGMYQLVDALRERLSCEWMLNTRVNSVARDTNGWRLDLGDQQISADDVILTTPASTAASLIAPIHPELGSALSTIRFVTTATVSLAYLREDIPSDRPLDGFGVVAPAHANRKILACTWTTTKFKHRAPAGAVLLRAFVGGYYNESLAELNDHTLIELVRDEFATMFGIIVEPMMSAVYRWPKGNPQYDVGHVERVAAMESMAKTLPGFYFAGSSYHGVGLPDCIRSALRAVDAIIPDAGRSQPS